jgi:hypothetical protein
MPCAAAALTLCSLLATLCATGAARANVPVGALAQDALAENSEPAQDTPAVSTLPVPATGPVRVDPTGRGHYTSIAEAVLLAGYDREIRIAPGVYREAVVLDHRVQLVADGGPVSIDGGERPAVAMDVIAQVVVRGLTLTSSVAAASVGRGQLVLEECHLLARPTGVALRTTDPRSQLVVRRSRVDAGAGTAMQLHMASSGEISDTSMTWGEGSPHKLLIPGAVASFVVWNTRLGWRTVDERALLADILAIPLPADGRLPMTVAPDRGGWPAWAREGMTHATSIGAALAVAAPGLRIDITPGTYHESVGLRQPAHLRPLGPPGSVVVRQEGVPCLWLNGAAGSVSTVRGLVLEGSVSENTAAVQVNGGRLDLGGCVVRNPAGHGVVVTSSWDASELVLAGTTIECQARGLFVTGATTRVQAKNSSVFSETVAVFVIEGGATAWEGGRIQAGQVGVELWGSAGAVTLAGCTLGDTPELVRLAKGATRSQLVTSDLVFEKTAAAANEDG